MYVCQYRLRFLYIGVAVEVVGDVGSETHVRRVEASGANIAVVLRRYHYFLAPADHEGYHSHGWYQCECRNDPFRIEQDKERHEQD